MRMHARLFATPARLAFAVLLSLAAHAHASASPQAAGLAGTWEWSDGAVTLTLQFAPDGTGALNGEGFRYTVRAGKLLVESETGAQSVYAFSLDGDALTISGGQLPRALTFTRKATRDGAAGLLEKNLGGAATPQRESEVGGKEEGKKLGGDGLTGRWQSERFAVEIFGDGTLTINGERFGYKAQGEYLRLTNDEGSIRIRYQLDGDKLVTDYEGERTVYRRARGAGAAIAGGGSANPPELFGKWCYMSNVTASNGGRMSNSCFTLRENGTYDYYGETSSSNPYGGTASQESDAGTWSVSGRTLIANSRSRGRLVFQLDKRNHPKTGDPMLLLDGQAFITYSPRTPWP